MASYSRIILNNASFKLLFSKAPGRILLSEPRTSRIPSRTTTETFSNCSLARFLSISTNTLTASIPAEIPVKACPSVS